MDTYKFNNFYFNDLFNLQSDLDLLKGLSDDEEEVLDDLDKDLEADPINRDQVRQGLFLTVAHQPIALKICYGP